MWLIRKHELIKLAYASILRVDIDDTGIQNTKAPETITSRIYYKIDVYRCRTSLPSREEGREGPQLPSTTIRILSRTAALHQDLLRQLPCILVRVSVEHIAVCLGPQEVRCLCWMLSAPPLPFESLAGLVITHCSEPTSRPTRTCWVRAITHHWSCSNPSEARRPLHSISGSWIRSAYPVLS